MSSVYYYYVYKNIYKLDLEIPQYLENHKIKRKKTT